MPLVTTASLAVFIGGCLFLWLSGLRFSRRYRATRGAMPPLTWMFRPTGDPELERWRQPALAILPFCVIALILYLTRP